MRPSPEPRSITWSPGPTFASRSISSVTLSGEVMKGTSSPDLRLRGGPQPAEQRGGDALHAAARAISVKPLRGNCSATTPAVTSSTPAMPNASQCVPKRS